MMAWKIILFFAVFTLCEARPPTSEQKVKIENWLSHIGSHEPESQEVYASAYPSYEFTYEVSDPHTHDFKGHHEQRKGDEVRGYYWLVQPDGLKRTVKYRADKHSGFNAHVEYIKLLSSDEKGNDEANEKSNSSEESSASSENDANAMNESSSEEENNSSDENDTEEEAENKIAIGIWQPNKVSIWAKRHSKETKLEERNENREDNHRRETLVKGGRRRKSRVVEDGPKKSGDGSERRRHNLGRGLKKHNSGKSDRNNEEQQENDNRNTENMHKQKKGHDEKQQKDDEVNNGEANDSKHIEHEGDKKVKSEYHVIIHHPKHYKNK